MECDEAVDLDTLIKSFPGYDNPYWYEKKNTIYTKFYYECQDTMLKKRLEWEMKRPNIKFTGTKPDIEIRWNDIRTQLVKRVEFTTSLPKMDDRGVIIGVKK